MKLFLAFLLAVSFTTTYAQTPSGLAIGDQAPDVQVRTHTGSTYQLSEAWRKGQVVLVFYRGQWCPYCNLYLRALEDSLAQLTSRGAKVIAISPELADGVAETMRKTGATYDVVSDADGSLMRAFGVDFAVDTATVTKYKSYKLDLAKANGTTADKVRLPVPATYIIGTDGRIRYRHFDPDYKRRATVAQLVAALPQP